MFSAMFLSGHESVQRVQTNSLRSNESASSPLLPQQASICPAERQMLEDTKRFSACRWSTKLRLPTNKQHLSQCRRNKIKAKCDVWDYKCASKIWRMINAIFCSGPHRQQYSTKCPQVCTNPVSKELRDDITHFTHWYLKNTNNIQCRITRFNRFNAGSILMHWPPSKKKNHLLHNKNKFRFEKERQRQRISF